MSDPLDCLLILDSYPQFPFSVWIIKTGQRGQIQYHFICCDLQHDVIPMIWGWGCHIISSVMSGLATHPLGPNAIWRHLVAVNISSSISIGIILGTWIAGDFQDSSSNARHPLGLDWTGRTLGTWLPQQAGPAPMPKGGKNLRLAHCELGDHPPWGYIPGALLWDFTGV